MAFSETGPGYEKPETGLEQSPPNPEKLRAEIGNTKELVRKNQEKIFPGMENLNPSERVKNLNTSLGAMIAGFEAMPPSELVSLFPRLGEDIPNTPTQQDRYLAQMAERGQIPDPQALGLL